MEILNKWLFYWSIYEMTFLNLNQFHDLKINIDYMR